MSEGGSKADKGKEVVRMTFNLRAEDRDRLERIRASMGLRSQSDALRKLIRAASK